MTGHLEIIEVRGKAWIARAGYLLGEVEEVSRLIAEHRMPSLEDLEMEEFLERSAPEPWTIHATSAKATLQQWMLQALADLTRDLHYAQGVSRPEWRRAVEMKIGKQSATSWRKAVQRLTAGGTAEGSLVKKVPGRERWLVDHDVVRLWNPEDASN